MSIWRRGLTGALAVIWILGLGWAWWWLDGRHARDFQRPAYFDGVEVAGPYASGQIQVLHVWQNGCPCNAGHEAYITDMIQLFSAQGVRFARAGSLPGGRGDILGELPHWPLPQQWADWPGGPSVAIWDADGKLAYVGPYSDGASCNQDSSFIEPVLRALLQGRTVNAARYDTLACLCELDAEAFAR
ncbi:MAG: thiol-disulfide isomerase [Gammaproteobacteria bacterium]|nr:thiol-disulfide isomerase [Gammaproteobacteria bacterium]